MCYTPCCFFCHRQALLPRHLSAIVDFAFRIGYNNINNPNYREEQLHDSYDGRYR